MRLRFRRIGFTVFVYALVQTLVMTLGNIALFFRSGHNFPSISHETMADYLAEDLASVSGDEALFEATAQRTFAGVMRWLRAPIRNPERMPSKS
ncbi:MAG: hypothetical protein K0S65_6173 [Labilithrix sp.]|nr:hypothetical protein [Labilithrix sp.]